MEAELARFNEAGFVVLRGVIGTEIQAAVRRDCETLVDNLAQRLKDAGEIRETCVNSNFENRMIHLFEETRADTPTNFRRELHLSGFFGLFAHPKLLDLAEQILGGEIRLYPNYSVRPKLPEDPRTEVLWHQDAGYTAADAHILRMINVWTPLVPATVTNGCMQVVPGSHRQGVVDHIRTELYLTISDELITEVETQAISIELDPGDVLLFSNLLLHRGLPNRSDHVRWSVDFRYQDAKQGTMRNTRGHLLRSSRWPEQVVRDAAHWVSLDFR